MKKLLTRGEATKFSETSRSADLYQAYGELRRERFELRLGRQEIVLGSGFLLGADTFFHARAIEAAVSADLAIPAPLAEYVAHQGGGRGIHAEICPCVHEKRPERFFVALLPLCIRKQYLDL